jgi:hypothetical protein
MTRSKINKNMVDEWMLPVICELLITDFHIWASLKFICKTWTSILNQHKVHLLSRLKLDFLPSARMLDSDAAAIKALSIKGDQENGWPTIIPLSKFLTLRYLSIYNCSIWNYASLHSSGVVWLRITNSLLPDLKSHPTIENLWIENISLTSLADISLLPELTILTLANVCNFENEPFVNFDDKWPKLKQIILFNCKYFRLPYFFEFYPDWEMKIDNSTYKLLLNYYPGLEKIEMRFLTGRCSYACKESFLRFHPMLHNVKIADSRQNIVSWMPVLKKYGFTLEDNQTELIARKQQSNTKRQKLQ